MYKRCSFIFLKPIRDRYFLNGGRSLVLKKGILYYFPLHFLYYFSLINFSIYFKEIRKKIKL